jgi:hypothetical protein
LELSSSCNILIISWADFSSAVITPQWHSITSEAFSLQTHKYLMGRQGVWPLWYVRSDMGHEVKGMYM